MTKLLCPNATLSDRNNYSAPVPFIGLYIAAGTLVCFLFIMCDIVHGFRSRKPWIPCRFFSLDSVTLTLLAIAAKLPVDLTTSMPSAYDQLSKLTATALICVCMVYVQPSIGKSRPSDRIANMAALTIFVVTVIVNVCIQMSTGVIFSFIVEHAIIMFCMLALLTLLWLFTWEIEFRNEINTDRYKDLFMKGKGSTSMLQRLKLCYLHGYNSNPQILPGVGSLQMHLVCVVCLVVVLHVTFRLLIGHEFKFCNEVSDYGWSIRIIVLAQILVILLANLAAVFRWISMSSIARLGFVDQKLKDSKEETTLVICKNRPFMEIRENPCLSVFKATIYLGYLCTLVVFLIPSFVVGVMYTVADNICNNICIRYVCSMCASKKPEGIQEYKDLLSENGLVLRKWTLRKCVEDIKRCMSVSKRNSLSHVQQLLSKTLPSQQSLEQLNSQFNFREGNEVSCLYLVFLERIVSVSIPSKSDILTRSLTEVFDIIHFVDTKTNSSRFNNRIKCKLAKGMRAGKDFRILLPKIAERTRSKPSQPQSDTDCALEIIRELKTVLPPSFIWDEVGIVMDWIMGREYTSVEELYDYMEQLFVDMLHRFLIQLPNAIFKEVSESHVEEYEDKVRSCWNSYAGLNHWME